MFWLQNNAGAAELASDKKHGEMSKEEKKAERKDERKVRSLERQLEHEKVCLSLSHIYKLMFIGP